LLVCGKVLVSFLAGYGSSSSADPVALADQAFAVAHFYGVLLEVARCLLPIFGTLFVAGVLVHLVQGGLSSCRTRCEDLSRIDPWRRCGGSLTRQF